MMTNNERNSYFAVIDTETNWNNEVMSIGIAIADSQTFELKSTRYYILTPECNVGGMYSFVLEMKKLKVDMKNSRDNVISDIIQILRKYNIDSIFAYNATFDYNHLLELKEYKWFDIMRLAAYKQYNKALPAYADYCGTGRLKRNYGVEPIMRLLSGSRYYEKHNALYDAVDELKIMELLSYGLDGYAHAQINAKKEKRICNKHKTSNELYVNEHKDRQKMLDEVDKYKSDLKYSKISEASHSKRKSTIEAKSIKRAVTSAAKNTLKYSLGDNVIHIDYGKGVVTEVRLITADLYFIAVTFKLYGEMVFQMPYNEKYFSEANE